MRWLRSIASELLGLFVDDWHDALAILVWLAAGWLLLPRLGLPGALPPVLLFAGLAVILLASALRRARRR